ncbi:MAG: hypothetical protein KAJ49_03360 [Arcobacteraceae bacterium]|nr:hypothetical protein [Arcobacteraceae bacterium]
MIEKFNQEHNGAKFINIRSNQSNDAVCCLGEKRFVINGKPKISFMENSWKFGKQIQFSLICPKETIKEEGRNNSKWNVVEIDIPFEEGKEMIKEAYNLLFKDIKKEEKQSTLKGEEDTP